MQPGKQDNSSSLSWFKRDSHKRSFLSLDVLVKDQPAILMQVALPDDGCLPKKSNKKMEAKTG